MAEEARSDRLPAEFHAGRLEGIRLPDLMWGLCQRSQTGVLEIFRAPIRRRLYLNEGRIVFASSSDPNDRLGELLLREGRITLDQLEVALSQLRSGKRLGALLVDAGALTNDQLARAVTHQVKSIVLDVLTWDRGDYRFDEGPLPTQELITLEVRTAELLLLAIRNVRSFSRIRASVGPPATVYSLAEGWEKVRPASNLTAAEQLVIARLERGVASVERLCEELAVSNFEIYQTLWAFRVLGLVRELPWVREPRGEASLSGRLDDVGFAELLVRAQRRAQIGVLYVSCGAVERSFHIAGGRCVFATSNEADDGLLPYLLRRGVISLQDREETCKRLLSNKRVGTILRELGVIDASELASLVRLQLGEIVYDTFRWDHGEYVFIPGPLPSNEEITLDADLLTLVGQGIRRIDSWTRVIRGCGGVDQPLALTQDHLEVLERTGAGLEEMDVVRALASPQSPRRVCRMVDLDDFRVCRILWTLRLVGAVHNAPVEDVEELLASLPQAAPPAPAPALERAAGEQEEVPDHSELLELQAVAPHEIDQKLLSAAEAGPAPASTRPGDSSTFTREAVERQLVEVELPAGIDELIGRFNAMHQLVYHAVRAEIGAGAINFVRACCGHAVSDEINPLEGVRLHADGSWDAEGLKRVIADKRIADPWPVYRKVLDREYLLLSPHLGAKRADVLKQEIWKLDQAIQSASDGSSPAP